MRQPSTIIFTRDYFLIISIFSATSNMEIPMSVLRQYDTNYSGLQKYSVQSAAHVRSGTKNHT